MNSMVPAAPAWQSPTSGVGLAPPGMIASVVIIALRELGDAMRSRWFALYSIAFAALGLAVSYVSAAGAGGAGLAGFGRTAAGLVNLTLLVVPLMAMTAGAASIASERERGMLPYLLSQPVARTEVLLGKYIGLAATLLASICLGLGACTLILALKGGGAQPGAMLWLAGLAFVLALGMLSLGMLLSTVARKASAAVGTAVFVWLALAFVSDLGLMAGTVALRLRVPVLFGLSLLNPLQVFKMWSLHAVDASLDVLGPAGLYAVEEIGSGLHLLFAACLGAWIVVPMVASAVIFSRRSPV